MKLQLEREQLLNPLQMVIGVVDRKQTMAILSHVLMDFTDQKLSLTGTDTEIQLKSCASLKDKMTSFNQVTVPGKKLMEICRALPENAPIELYYDKGRMVLSSGRSRFILATLPVEEFPNVEAQTYALNFTLEQKQLLSLLQRSAFAMAQQDVRYYLNGMLLEINNYYLRTVATDGHRLACNTIPFQFENIGKRQIIVPKKGIQELLRLLKDQEEEISISINNNHIHIENSSFSFISKLIESRFPDYDLVIPKQTDKNIVLNRNELEQALCRCAILCSDKFHGVRFEFRQNLLRIYANNPEQEVAEEEISIDYLGQEMDIGFNVHYWLDILRTVQSEQIILHFKESNEGVRITEQESNSELNSQFVIMPLRL